MLGELTERLKKTFKGSDKTFPDWSHVDLGPDYPAIRAHVLRRIAETPAGTAPFHHAWMTGFSPRTISRRCTPR